MLPPLAPGSLSSYGAAVAAEWEARQRASREGKSHPVLVDDARAYLSSCGPLTVARLAKLMDCSLQSAKRAAREAGAKLRRNWRGRLVASLSA